jgi:hypothetical protein
VQWTRAHVSRNHTLCVDGGVILGKGPPTASSHFERTAVENFIIIERVVLGEMKTKEENKQKYHTTTP